MSTYSLQVACDISADAWRQAHDNNIFGQGIGGGFQYFDTDALPSIGSRGHIVGECKPCAFLHTKGCSLGKDCEFCHLCGSDEKKKRQTEKRQYYKQLRASQTHSATKGLREYPVGGLAAPNSRGLWLAIETQFEEADTVSTEEPTSFPSTPSPMGLESRPSVASMEAEKAASSDIVLRSPFIEVSAPTQSEISFRRHSDLMSCPAAHIGSTQLTVCTDFDDEAHSPSLPSTVWPATPEPLTPLAEMQPHAMLFHSTPFIFQTVAAPVVVPGSETLSAAPVNHREVAPPPLYAMQGTCVPVMPTCCGNVCENLGALPQVGNLEQTAKARVLSLDEMLVHPSELQTTEGMPSTSERPSLGSELHHLGTCKPCGFFHRAGCAKGAQCEYCHLCDPEEKKKRQKEKREMMRAAARLGA